MKTKKLLLVSAFLFFAIQFGFAQNKVSGTVTNASDGSPIPGVNVVIQGGSASTSTGFDGKYTIDAAPGTSLTFSYIGYNSKTVKATGNLYDVKLSENANALDQVVVVGSTVKTSRKELGNAITSVKSKELLRAQPNSLSSALQGKVAGAQISQNNGDPSGGFSIKLRGTSSLFGSSDPLYVIDGVVSSNITANLTNLNVGTNSNMQLGQNRTSDINPNDIESVEILNGGAAAAIYGSRASNGVVLITTKKGKSGATKYTFSTSTTINQLRKKVYTNMSDREFTNVRVDATSPTGFSPNESLFILTGQPASYVALSPSDYVNVNATRDPLTLALSAGTNLNTQYRTGVKRYDYQDNIFETGFGNDTYFSLNGGSDKTKYFASVGYLKNEGIVKNTDFGRIGVKLRLVQEINPKLSATFGLNYVNSTSNEKPDGNRFWSPLNSINITNNIYDINRRDNFGNLLGVEPNRVNPLSVIEKIDIEQKTDRVITDFQLNYKPIKNFTADFIFGVDTYNQRGTTFIPRYPYSTVTNAVFSDGYASEAIDKVTLINSDINLNYIYNLNKNFKFTTAAGLNIQTENERLTATEGRDLKPFVETLSAFNTLIGVASVEVNKNIWGYYLQETVGIFNKLFLTGAIRLDASTAFAKENRNNIYKKLSGSYAISDHDIFKDTYLSTARIRASWGESGNQSGTGAYTRFTPYTAGNLVGNSTFTLQGLRVGNPDIKPEKSVTFEYGTDVGFFDDRFTASFSYYNTDIEDLVVPIQSAASTGTASQVKNIGTMNNKGIELSLKYDVIRNENLNFSLNGTFSKNKNVVTGLTNQSFFQLDSNEAGAPVFVKVGSPVGIYYGTYYATNPDGSLLLTTNGYPQQERGGSISGLPERDSNGQPIGTPLNKEIGDPNPDYIISMGANLTYKKFGVSVLFDGVQGNDIFDADYRTRQGVGLGEFATKELNGELPRGYIASFYPVQEFRVVDGSYIKLREVSLNYSFGKLNNTFSDLTITASGRNLYSWDNFPSYDPETNSAGQSSIAKYNFGTIPIPRSFALALKFQF